MQHLHMLIQAVQPADGTGWWHRVFDFINTPAPYSPFSEYLLLMFILWLVARRANRKRTFDTQAQDVLDKKYEEGELSQKAYEKYRQEMSVRPKR